VNRGGTCPSSYSVGVVVRIGSETAKHVGCDGHSHQAARQLFKSAKSVSASGISKTLFINLFPTDSSTQVLDGRIACFSCVQHVDHPSAGMA
jgi:hypothetical protein